MARTVARLTDLGVKRKKKAGFYPDGGGLYLQVTGDGDGRIAKSWLYRFALRGKRRDMGLGSLAAISLADARSAAAEARKLRQTGIDPIEHRRAQRAAGALEAAKAVTFEDHAKTYIEAQEGKWRSSNSKVQWENSLNTYAYPVIGKQPVAAIDDVLVLKVLEPIWQTKTETASRVRQRIEAILDSAKARKLREGENPARWRGHLEHILAAPSELKDARSDDEKHHAALPYAELSEFMKASRAQSGMAARALEFAILTAARTAEVLGAKWSELDLDGCIWTVPGVRMKSGKEHRRPLSKAAIALLRDQQGQDVEYIFPGSRALHPMHRHALALVLNKINPELTVHGFRSSFRDWCAERTSYPSEVAEMALAHTVGDKVEAAYRRGDLFEKRRRLAKDWAKFCATGKTSGNVVSLRKQA